MAFTRAFHTFRAATSIARGRPAYAAGARASIATVVPLALAQLLHLGEAATWMSLGGFNGALSDRGGSYSSKAWTMAALIATGSVATAIATLVAGHLAISVAATFGVAFVASILRVWGNPGISVGIATLSTYVVALAIPAEHAHDALTRPAYVIVGGLWAMSIALVIWPLRPYRPARLAIAECYAALADYIDQVAASARLQQTAEWPIQHAPPVVTSVRIALEEARAVLVQIRRGRPGKVDRGERLLILGETADQLFGHVVALSETLGTLRGPARNEPAHERGVSLLREVSATARAISVAVEAERNAEPIPVTWNGDRLRESFPAGAGAIDSQYEHAAIILDRASQFASSASVTVESLNGNAPSTELVLSPLVRAPAAEELSEQTPVWDSFRAMLSPGSLILRFALRVAVVTSVAVALTDLYELKRGYWVTITVIVILQPYTGVTFTRAVQRVIGTVLGALLAAGLGTYFHDPRAILVIATVFVAFCVALMPLNYAAFSVFLTPTFVLLAEASAGEWDLAGTRVLNTLLGGALALIGSRLLWPSPELDRFSAYAAAALRANASYLRSVFDRYDDRSHESSTAMRDARRSIGLATVNAEESLQRALSEVHGRGEALAPALTLVAYVRRFTATVAALALTRHVRDGTTRAMLEPLCTAVCSALEECALSLEGGGAALPLDDAIAKFSPAPFTPLVRARLERLARQVGTLHDAVGRLTQRDPAVVPILARRV